jgi:hypothetical protein
MLCIERDHIYGPGNDFLVSAKPGWGRKVRATKKQLPKVIEHYFDTHRTGGVPVRGCPLCKDRTKATV